MRHFQSSGGANLVSPIRAARSDEDNYFIVVEVDRRQLSFQVISETNLVVDRGNLNDFEKYSVLSAQSEADKEIEWISTSVIRLKRQVANVMMTQDILMGSSSPSGSVINGAIIPSLWR